MRIVIAQRLHPFVHRPGAYVVLPGSSLEIQIFPALLIVRDLSAANPREVARISLNIQGPVEKFTIEQDLERGRICIWGHTLLGYFRYFLWVRSPSKKISIYVEKALVKDWLLTDSQEVEWCDAVDLQALHVEKGDRLSLGSHRAQDWDLVSRRMDFAEIFPVWHRLGQLVLCDRDDDDLGTAVCLRQCEEAIFGGAPEKILPAFRILFRVGFQGVLSPRLYDEWHQGINYPVPDENSSPLLLLKRGSELIRSLFLQANQQGIHLLPALPPEFHCGRFLDIPCGRFGYLDMEWSKKCLRRMIIRPILDETVRIVFQKGIKSFRLRQEENDRGQVYTVTDPIKLTAQTHYFFDNFQY